MIISARDIDPGKILDANLCVVGAGAAGITLALELERRGIDTVVLEGGGEEYDAQSQDLHGGECVGERRFDIRSTRLRRLGGTTQHWGGMSPRMVAGDLERREGVPLSGWPIAYTELSRWYETAATYCEVSERYWFQKAKEDEVSGGAPQFARGPLRAILTPWSPPTRFGDRYRAHIRDSKRIRLILHANVCELQTGRNPRLVESARVVTLQHGAWALRARSFVLATGGLEVPRLLLNSKSAHASGLGNGSGWVGRCYMDHLGLWSGVALFRKPFRQFHRLTEWLESGSSRARYTLVPQDTPEGSKAQVNFRFLLDQTPVSYEGVSASRRFIEEVSSLRLPPRLGPGIADMLLDADELAAKVLKRPGLGRDGGARLADGALLPHAFASLSMEQLPNPQSRVTLADSRDLTGMPRLRLDWRILPADRENIRSAAMQLGRAMADNGLGSFYLPSFVRDLDLDGQVQIASHHMGTARMSVEARNGVVDSNLRLHDAHNVYVASSAVFPTGGWANPTLTIVALAARLASHLSSVERRAT
jgi:choline dehydrogenase-like flavoprotein